MDSANFTIPLRGLQYIASPEPNSIACLNRLHPKTNTTSTLLSKRHDKYNATLPVLNDTQCHSTKTNEHREMIFCAKHKETCDMTKVKQKNLCAVGDDILVSSATISAQANNFANNKEFAKILSRFSESTRQMLNLDKPHNTNTLSQSLSPESKCTFNRADGELHNLNDKKVNSKINRADKKEATTSTDSMKDTQHKSNTMPIITRKSDMHPYSLSMNSAMKTLPLRQTCKDYCFTSLSTTIARHYATPSDHYLCLSTSGQHEQSKINARKDNNGSNTNTSVDKTTCVANSTNYLNSCNNVDPYSSNHYSNTIGATKQFESTLMRKAGNVPPLVIALRSHIQRELDCIAHKNFNEGKIASATSVGEQESTINSNNSCKTKREETLFSVTDNHQDGSYLHDIYDKKYSEMCVVDQLLPYREALVALRSALPGYELFLEEIQVAYDRVIEAQAELLTDAYAKEAIKEFTSEEQREEALKLRQQVNDLTTTLNQMRVELETRRRLAAEAADEDGDEYDGIASNNNVIDGTFNFTSGLGGNVVLKKSVNRSRSALAKARSDFFEATQKLQLAQQRIVKLEQNSKGDLEKILVLIGAVRECDRRLKSYEQTVKTMSGQIEELDEFKRLAAEAQAELQRYKERYECFVALGDFELMRQHLTDELASSQAMSRRLRRTAAVRGTQVEVMQRRLNTLEEELATLRSNGVNSSKSEMTTLTGTMEKRLSSTQLLTPRPNWAAVHRKVHEMAEETKPIFCYCLPLINETHKLKEEQVLSNAVNNISNGTVNNSTTTTTVNTTTTTDADDNNVVHTSEINANLKHETIPTKNNEEGAVSEDEELLVVNAAKETSSQVDLLVDHIIHLQRQVHELSSWNTLYQICVQKWLALPERLSTLPVDKVGKNNGIVNSLHSSRNYDHEKSSDTAIVASTVGAVVTNANNNLLAILENGRDALNLLEPEFVNSELSKRLQSMQSAWILGPGVESEIPAYLRVSGCVQRIVVAPKTRCRLIFNFFTEILQPLFSEPYNSKSALAELFATFLESQVEEEESLSQFTCNAHLALNLEVDCHTPSLNNPPLLLLFNILHHRMPVRLAIDAVEVVSHAMSDITALAKEQRKARLRRGAVSECLALLLELMTISEIAELRVALGEELTFDAVALASIDSRFMRTLFYQSCQSSMDLYTNLVQKLTLRSTTVVNEEHIPNQVISTRDVAEIILAVEPRTPEIVIRELTENALKSCMQSDETNGNDDMLKSTLETSLYLNEVIKAVGEAPIIRRTAQSMKDDCNL